MVFPVKHHTHGSSSSSHQVSGGGPEGEGEQEGKAGSEGGADGGVEAGLFEIDLNEERLEGPFYFKASAIVCV